MNPEIRSLCNASFLDDYLFTKLCQIARSEDSPERAFSYIASYANRLKGLYYLADTFEEFQDIAPYLPWPCVKLFLPRYPEVSWWSRTSDRYKCLGFSTDHADMVVSLVIAPNSSITENRLKELHAFVNLEEIENGNFHPLLYGFPKLTRVHKIRFPHQDEARILTSEFCPDLVRSLTHLGFCITELWDGWELQTVQKFEKLESLSITVPPYEELHTSAASLYDLSNVKHLKQIEITGATFTEYTHLDLHVLTKLSLESLSFPHSSEILADYLYEWGSYFPDIKHLNLACSEIIERVLPALSYFKTLETLNVSCVYKHPWELEGIENHIPEVRHMVLDHLPFQCGIHSLFDHLEDSRALGDLYIPDNGRLTSASLLGWDLEPYVEEILTHPTLSCIYISEQSDPKVVQTLENGLKVIVRDNKVLEDLSRTYEYRVY